MPNVTTDQPNDEKGTLPGVTARRRKRRFGQALKHPIVSGLIVTVVGSAIVAVLMQRDGDGSDSRPATSSAHGEPLRATVQPDRDVMSSTGFSVAVPGRLPRDPPEANADCFAARAWLIRNGGADVGSTHLEVTLAATAGSTVAVNGARIEVIDQIKPRTETLLDCPSRRSSNSQPSTPRPPAEGYGVVDVTSIAFDLDEDEPRAESGGSPLDDDDDLSEHTLNVEPGKPETVSVRVSASSCRCRWHLVLELSADRGYEELVIDDRGKAFRTVALSADPEPAYGWGRSACADRRSPCALG